MPKNITSKTKSNKKKFHRFQYKNRIDVWKEEIRVPVIFFGETDDEVLKLAKERYKNSKEFSNKDSGLSFSLIKVAKELIFDIEDNKSTIYIVTYGLDQNTFDLVISPVIKAVGLSANTVKQYLVQATVWDVPVYPNNDKVAPQLIKLQKELLNYGFTFSNESGQEVQYKLTKLDGIDIENFQSIEKIKFSQVLLPSEFFVIKETLVKELEMWKEAGLILASLRSAIKDLSDLLIATKRNENDLQRCLTTNSILFGAEYQRIIPKHKLGSEYEMDYALERVSGLVDLVEIEASTHPLFTKDGNPSRYLVHAEQQVLDWLEWIENYSPYARNKLPGLSRPIGYVIIGRSNSLSSKTKEKLTRRNIAFQSTLQILTFDDLLERARNLLHILEGKSFAKPKIQITD